MARATCPGGGSEGAVEAPSDENDVHPRRAGGRRWSLGGRGLLTVGPAPASVRVGGVGLAWWYGVVVAPAVATLLALAVGPAAASRASVVAWVNPALVAALAAAVFRGDPGAPLLVLLAVLTPLLVLLATRRAARRDAVTAALGV